MKEMTQLAARSQPRRQQRVRADSFAPESSNDKTDELDYFDMAFANMEPISDSHRLNSSRDRVDSQESTLPFSQREGVETNRILLLVFLAFCSTPLSIFQFVIIPYSVVLQEEL